MNLRGMYSQRMRGDGVTRDLHRCLRELFEILIDRAASKCEGQRDDFLNINANNCLSVREVVRISE